MSSQFQGSRDDRLVIGITGRIGAGKTSAGRYLSLRYGFQYLRYSQVLSEWLTKDSESKAHLQQVGWEVMAGGMQVELNHRLIAQMNPQADAAVDGLRHPIDYASLKKAFASSFHLLYIESPREERWNRLAGAAGTRQLMHSKLQTRIQSSNKSSHSVPTATCAHE